MQNGETNLEALLRRVRNEVRKRKSHLEALEGERHKAAREHGSGPEEFPKTRASQSLGDEGNYKVNLTDAKGSIARAHNKNESIRHWPRFLRGIRRNQGAINESLIDSVGAVLEAVRRLNANFLQQDGFNRQQREQLILLTRNLGDLGRQVREQEESRRAQEKRAANTLQQKTSALESQIVQQQHQLAETQRFIDEQVRQTAEEHRQFQELQQRLAEIRNGFQAYERNVVSREEFLKEINHLGGVMTALRDSLGIFQEFLSKGKKAPLSKPAARSLDDTLKQHETDAFYLAFENQFRGTREQIKDRLRFYIPIILETKNATGTTAAIDVACGRGEWLELLREHGFEGSGVDLNACMIEECRSRGLKVECADAIAYLRGIPAASLSIITGFHIAEHLTLDQLLALFRESFRVLQAQGKAIFETPNPECSKVASYSFFLDPTHRNPIPQEFLCFAARHAGFGATRIERLQPYFEDGAFKGYLDYSGIFTK